MEIFPVWRRGPFVSDESGKAARIVPSIGVRNDATPSCPLDLFVLNNVTTFEERDAEIREDFQVLARRSPFRPAFSCFGLEQHWIFFVEHIHHAQILGMITQQDKVERPTQLYGHAVMRDDRLPARKPVDLLRVNPTIAHVARIRRPTRMNVRIPEIDVPRAFVVGVGRIALATRYRRNQQNRDRP